MTHKPSEITEEDINLETDLRERFFCAVYPDQKRDEKNRLKLPAAFGKLLRPISLVVRHTDKPYLSFYPVDFSKLNKQVLIDIAPFSDEVRKDTQDRITLSPKNLAHLQLQEGETVTLVGCGDHLEIWSPREWQRERPHRASLAERALKEGIPISLPEPE